METDQIKILILTKDVNTPEFDPSKPEASFGPNTVSTDFSNRLGKIINDAILADQQAHGIKEWS